MNSKQTGFLKHFSLSKPTSAVLMLIGIGLTTCSIIIVQRDLAEGCNCKKPAFSDPGTQLSLFNEISAQKKTAQTGGGLERTLPSIADVVAPSTLNKSGPITTEPAKTELAKAEPVIPVIPPASKAPTATEVVSSVTAEINRWRDAWQNKQVEQYFAQYVDGFSGDFASAKQWRKQRQTKILAGKNIKITLLDLKVMPVDSTRVNVSFIQQYQSGTYKDSGTKTLTLKKVQERWLIEHELFSTAKEAAAETPTVAPSLTTPPMAAVAQPPVVETKVTPAASPKISPTLSAPVPPAVTALTATEITANVTAEINDWRDSWQNKQVEQYLAHYVEGFSGDLGNAGLWREQRQAKITAGKSIRITLLDIKVTPVDATTVKASFIQQYASGTYKDSGVKTLRLKKVRDQWLIDQELFAPK